MSNSQHGAASLQRAQGHRLCAARTVLPVLRKRATASPTRLPQHVKPALAPQLVTAPCPSAEQHAAPRNVSTAAATPDAAAGEPAQPQHLFAKKVAALSLIFVGATINYTILQSLKDAMIVTSCGAEALPLISAFGVLPASVAFIMYYDNLVAKLDSKAVFYWALAPMVAFYAVFAAVLLPNADALQPVALATKYCAQLPESLGCFVRVASNWVYSLFFILGELWGSVAISLLFWSLADDLCNVDEAKDVYPKLGILANFGLIVAGAFTRFVSYTLAKDNEVLSLQILTAAIVAMTGLMCVVKNYVDTSILPYVYSKQGGKKEKKKSDKAGGGGEAKKEKAGTWELLTSSPRILNMTLMVMGYGICHKLFGFVWKGQMRLLYPSTAAYATVMADVASFTGACTIGLMLVSKFFFQVLGWGGAALATPLVMLVSGAIFFAGSLFPPGTALPGTALAMLLALGPAAGIVAQVFGRAAKYSLFDPSKEMVFITMGKEEKEAGKAAVDVLGNQIGKTGGSWLMQAALLLCGSMSGALPVAAAAYMAVCFVWLNATMGLARDMSGPEEGKMVLASADGAPMMQAPGPNTLTTPSGQVLHLPANWADKEIKESMQSHFD